MVNVCVVGTGYVGLVTGACLADFGNTVRCIDIDEAKIEKLKRGEMTFYEPGLQEIVKRNIDRGRLAFSTDINCGIEDSTVIFVAVGTPMGADGKADLRYVEMVAKSVAENLNDYKVVVLKSTVPAGTGLERSRNSVIVSIRRASRAVEVSPEKITLPPRVMRHEIIRL